MNVVQVTSFWAPTFFQGNDKVCGIYDQGDVVFRQHLSMQRD